MKKIILVAMVFALLGVSNAVTLSSVAANVVPVNTTDKVICTASYGSQWIIVPAASAYLNQLNTVTATATCPVVATPNVYKVSVGKSGSFNMTGVVSGNVVIYDATRYPMRFY